MAAPAATAAPAAASKGKPAAAAKAAPPPRAAKAAKAEEPVEADSVTFDKKGLAAARNARKEATLAEARAKAASQASKKK